MLRRLLAVLFLLATVLVVAPAGPAWACSCGALRRTGDLVVVGVVESVRRTSGDELQVRLRVDVIERGSAGAQVELSTAAQDTACGYEFREGHRYRVYGNQGTTSSCAGNEDLGLADPPSGGTTGALWWSLGSGAVVVAALILLSRRGKRR